jgi:membrane protein
VSLWRGIDWKKLLRSLVKCLSEHNISNGAGALAFSLVLALFPAAIFLVSLLPYLPVAHLTDAIMQLVRRALPGEAADMVTSTVASVLSSKNGGLLSFGLLFSAWSATSGLHAVMLQLNVVYGVRERRPLVKVYAIAFLLSIAFGLLVVAALVLLVFGGYLQSFIAVHLGSSGALGMIFAALRWMLVLVALELTFSLVYRLGPNVVQPSTFLAPGTVFATVALVVASAAFRIYVDHFAKYNAVYGGLGAVIALLMWLYLAGWVVLLGGEINHLAECQKGVMRQKRM